MNLNPNPFPTPGSYNQMLERLRPWTEGKPSPRFCEAPVFLPPSVMRGLLSASEEVVGALPWTLGDLTPIPPEFRVSSVESRPTFLVLDFALTGSGFPQLIELQAFPSIFAHLWFADRLYRASLGLSESWTPFFTGDAEDYRERLRRAIIGDLDPAEVVILELWPERQKTLWDLNLSREMLGLEIVDLERTERRGDRLFYRRRDGRSLRIRGAYNRVVPPELQLSGRMDLADRFQADVRWENHPHAFFRVSKHLLPMLRMDCVPRAYFTQEFPATERLEDYVLKPVHLFSANGVKLRPTRADLAAYAPGAALLQRRTDYGYAFETPAGPRKIEVRMMLLRNGETYEPLSTFIRASDQDIINVAHQRSTWTGVTTGYFRRDQLRRHGLVNTAISRTSCCLVDE